MASSILQKLLPNTKIQAHIFRAVLYLALLVCVALFASQLNQQAKRNDVKATLDTLLKDGQARTLENVEITYLLCPKKFDLDQSKCDREKSGKPVVHDTLLANITKIPKITPVVGEAMQANWALIRYNFTKADYDWFSENSISVLALPRNIHNRTYFLLPGNDFWHAAGLGADTTFTLARDDLLAMDRVELLISFAGMPYFGPSDIPAHFVRPKELAKFLSLIGMQKEASSLTRQLELGLPVVLAAIAIILDHSTVMSYLSLYAASRAIHDYIGFRMEAAVPQYIEKKLYFISVGTGFAFLVLFTAVIVGLNVRRIKLSHRWMFVCIMGALFGLGEYVDPSFSTTSDLWGDSLAIFSCFLVIFYAAYDRIKNPPSPETKASNPESYSRVSVALVATRLAIVCIAFAVHGWSNVRDLIGHSTDSDLKSRLDWKTMILMPALMTAALLEVGSTAKKMLNFGRDMATKALIEQELQVGREVQVRMLPNLRATTPSWHWRAMYLPAEALAGDWFDIRELNFADGRSLLVACVADVTGHGVGSSLATSVICSHWGLWCTRLMESGFPETSEEKHQAIRRAPYAIHSGLKALRENENCTAIFAIFDPVRNEITFCSAGHPGILSIGKTSFRYFTTQGERLGGEVLGDLLWNAKTESLAGDELLVLYSDGVVPLRATVSSWAAQIKRKVTSGSVERPELMLVKQLQTNKHGFADAPDLKDDMTLVMVRRNTTATVQKAEPESEEAQRSAGILKSTSDTPEQEVSKSA
ncbi:MAG: Phosphoserine phosphatase RsbP [Pseudomonadota bacterium]